MVNSLRYKFICSIDGPINYVGKQKVRYDLLSHDYVDSDTYVENKNDDGIFYVLDKDFSKIAFNITISSIDKNFHDDATNKIVSSIIEYKLKLRKLKLNKI